MTADSFELISLARRLVERAYRRGFEFTKAGIMLEQLAAADARPRTLFENQDQSAQRERLMAAIDDINGKFGRMTVVPGSQGFKRSWKMRADMKSPAWTTRISDLPVVKAWPPPRTVWTIA